MFRWHFLEFGMSPEGEQLLFGGTWGTFRSQQKVGSPANDFPRLLRLCRNVCQLKVQPTAPEKRKTSTKNLRTLKLGGQKPAPNSGNDPYRKKGEKKTSKSNLHSLKLQEQSSNFSLQWNSSKNHQEDFSQEVRMCA